MRIAATNPLPFLCYLSLLLFCSFAPTIKPPEGFASCDQKDNPRVISSFIEKRKMSFSPSITVYVEDLQESKTSYEKKIKKHFSSLQDTQVTYLPSLSTPHGKAIVLQIDKNHTAGNLRLFQMILIHEKKSYIVTCCALKKDFPSYEKKFLDTMQSFRLL